MYVDLNSPPEYRKNPISRAGGPWGADSPKSYGNYIITTSSINVDTVSDWISHLKTFGIDQVDFHQGGAFRQGDFVFDEEAYPNGIADFRKMTDRLKENGMIAGLHTYAEFLPGNSIYVSPVPSPDLDTLEQFTLAADIAEDDDAFTVTESTAEVSTETGFFVRNSRVLQIDNELILFSTPQKDAPYGFADCQRGAFGTVKAPHQKGTAVRHLTQMFGLFAPRADSDLFLEVARRTAQTYNEGGFSMIYLDALDGTYTIVPDRELVWFYQTLFVNEMLKYCDSAPLLEYSTMDNNIWLGRSRMGAWDSAHRGYRPFFENHFQSNHLTADRAFLPGQIGWLALSPASGYDHPDFQKHTLYCEDVHYLGAKSAARNYGYSLLDIPMTGILPAAAANGAILAQYDRLRRSGTLSEEKRAALADPGRDFVLVPDSRAGDGDVPDGDVPDLPAVVPAYYHAYEVSPEHQVFSCENNRRAQRPYIRIENRYDAGDYDSPNAVTLFDFEETPLEGVMKTATFDPPADLSNVQALGLWVRGTKSGTKYNIRLNSPRNLSSGHLDHFFTDDFTGWRYIALTRAQNGEEPSMNWPYSCGGIYSEYREAVDYHQVTDIQMMADRENSEVKFRSVKALELKEYSLVNPTLIIDGKRLTFPVEIPSGHYLEWDPQCGTPNEARVLTPNGEVIAAAAPEGDFTELPAGASEIRWESGVSADASFRAKLTVRVLGEPLP